MIYIYDRGLFEAGIWYIKDLFEVNEIIPFQTLQRRGVTMRSYMIWRSIVNIALQFMNPNDNLHNHTMLQQGALITNDVHQNSHDILKMKSREITSLLVQNKQVKSKIQMDLINSYDLSENELTELYLLPRRLLKNNKIKELQYKIINRYLPTNYLLFKMKKVSSYSCTFCQFAKETIKHVFIECYKVKNFWIELKDNIDYFKEVILSEQNILLGILGDSDESNKLIFYAKYYIWKCHCNQILPQRLNFERWLMNIC